MNKSIVSIILGVIGLMLGPFGLIFGGIGLFLGIKALKNPSKEKYVPIAKVGGKQVQIKSFMSTPWPAYIGIVLNALVLFFALIALLSLGLVGGLFFFSQTVPNN